MSTPSTAAAAPPTILPPRGMARVKNVMSGDTVVLLGSKPSTPGGPPPEVMFTMEQVSAPRYVPTRACVCVCVCGVAL